MDFNLYLRLPASRVGQTMPEKFVFKVLSKTVAAGATESVDWTFDADYTLRHIHGIDQDGADLAQVYITCRIHEKILTKDEVPGNFFTPSELGALDFALSVAKGEKIEFGLRNARTVDVTAYLVLELEKLR